MISYSKKLALEVRNNSYQMFFEDVMNLSKWNLNRIIVNF